MMKTSLRRARFLLALLFFVLLAGCAENPLYARFQGVEYRLVEHQGGTVIYESPFGDLLVVEQVGEGARVTAAGMVYRVAGSARESQVTFPDGRELTRVTQDGGSAGLAPNDVEVTELDWQTVDELRVIVFGAQAVPGAVNTGRILFGLLLVAFGALEVAFPRLAWQITGGRRNQDYEPSDVMLTIMRVAGVIIIVIGGLLLTGWLG